MGGKVDECPAEVNSGTSYFRRAARQGPVRAHASRLRPQYRDEVSMHRAVSRRRVVAYPETTRRPIPGRLDRTWPGRLLMAEVHDPHRGRAALVPAGHPARADVVEAA